MKQNELPDGFYDLGEKSSKLNVITVDDSKMEDGEVFYPSLYFRGKQKLKGLPKSGTATIHFKKVMERSETVTRDGETESCYCVELEIHGIKPEAADEEISTGQEMSDEDAIEEGLEAASEPESESEETETEEEED